MIPGLFVYIYLSFAENTILGKEIKAVETPFGPAIFVTIIAFFFSTIFQGSFDIIRFFFLFRFSLTYLPTYLPACLPPPPSLLHSPPLLLLNFPLYFKKIIKARLYFNAIYLILRCLWEINASLSLSFLNFSTFTVCKRKLREYTCKLKSLANSLE